MLIPDARAAETATRRYVKTVAQSDHAAVVAMSAERACERPEGELKRRAADRIERYGAVPPREVRFELISPPTPELLDYAVRLEYGAGRPSDIIWLTPIGGVWRLVLRDWESPEEREKLPELAGPEDWDRLEEQIERNPDPPPDTRVGTCEAAFGN